jgi:UDP-glucose 4-epimerase
VAKLAVEEYLAYYGRALGLASVSLRLANVYGPHQRPDGEMGVVAIFLGKILRGETLTIHGDGNQTRDFVYVDDVVSIHLRAAEGLHAGRLRSSHFPLNVATGIETPIREVADRLGAIAGVVPDVAHGPAKPGEQRRSVLDATRARTLLEWHPTTGLHEGLTRTFHWMRQDLDTGRSAPPAPVTGCAPPGPRPR